MEAVCWLHYTQGRLPTVRELMEKMKFRSPTGVVGYFEWLNKYGWIRRFDAPGKSHTWRVAVAPPDWVLLPGGGIVPREDLAGLVGRLQQELLAS